VFRLDGRAALITGAASGIGAATAEFLARAGANVALTWYPADPHDVAPVVRAVQEQRRRTVAIECDVGSTEEVDRAVATTLDAFGRIDIVVANAAIARLVSSVDLDDDRWNHLLNVDLTGVFRCFRAALPHMIDAGWGRLLATSSITGALMGWPQHVHYTAAKGGIVGLVRGLALEVARHGITVNAIAPGVIETPQSSDTVNSLGPEGLEAFAERVPVGRVGRPEDIASLFVFLASEEASYLTGQTILVDGGVSLSLAY
jgi:3-oxoacyl-[acyl-carrier protein] reductase